MPVSLWCEQALLPEGVRRAVHLVVGDDGRLVAVAPDQPVGPGDRRLAGLAVPGLADAHSHAFHRALRARTHRLGGDFWAWRERMYRVAGALDPDTMLRLATAAYGELALAGVTAVGEFHYLHHGPDGRPYDDPNAMGAALVEAARRAGLRLTLLDACYLQGGVDGRPLEGVQRRFGDGSAEAWAQRVGRLSDGPGLRVGAAVHSVRAVSGEAMALVAATARKRDMPLHLHLSEQPAENEDCRAATGRTPTELALERGVLGPSTTAVHATHLTPSDVGRLGATATGICLCPTTEADLGDGMGPAAALAREGSPLCLGSDSHAVVDLFEEARRVELHQRLAAGRRGLHDPGDLWRAATASGMAALGWDAGTLAAGRLADLVTLDVGSPRLAGFDPSDAPAHLVYAATAADVVDVVVGGEAVVSGRVHRRLGDVGRLLDEAIREVST